MQGSQISSGASPFTSIPLAICESLSTFQYPKWPICWCHISIVGFTAFTTGIVFAKLVCFEVSSGISVQKTYWRSIMSASPWILPLWRIWVGMPDFFKNTSTFFKARGIVLNRLCPRSGAQLTFLTVKRLMPLSCYVILKTTSPYPYAGRTCPEPVRNSW